MIWQEQALEKLARERQAFKGDRYASAMKDLVAEGLEKFCCQDEEFAQAVAQGGSFAACMAEVSKGVSGNYLSDLAAYRRAAAFFFRDAQVEMELRIRLEPEGPEDDGKTISLDFSDFFT